MKTCTFVAAAFTLLGLSVNAQTVNVNCNYAVIAGSYSCEIVGLTVADNENANFVIGGNHQTGRTNADVRVVTITSSQIPFIITQFFTTFPNLLLFSIQSSGLNRVQANAFVSATRLRVLSIDLNENLQTISEDAFLGLSSLISLSVSENSIRLLPANVFRPLTSLTDLSLFGNQLESLDGNLLANNLELSGISIARNRINAIGRNFIDNLPRLSQFFAVGNVCVDENWTIGGSTTLETVRAGLNVCFNNPSPDENELRRFVLEFRGPLSLRFENGTEIVRV